MVDHVSKFIREFIISVNNDVHIFWHKEPVFTILLSISFFSLVLSFLIIVYTHFRQGD